MEVETKMLDGRAIEVLEAGVGRRSSTKTFSLSGYIKITVVSSMC